VVVFDPEGDHVGLGRLRGVHVAGRPASCPPRSAGQLPADRRFYFRRNLDTATGVTAGSITELEHELRVCDDEVIIHHLRLADLSRWIGEVLGDPPLAAAVEQIEKAVRAGTASVAEPRARLMDVIYQRYQE